MCCLHTQTDHLVEIGITDTEVILSKEVQRQHEVDEKKRRAIRHYISTSKKVEIYKPSTKYNYNSSGVIINKSEWNADDSDFSATKVRPEILQMIRQSIHGYCSICDIIFKKTLQLEKHMKYMHSGETINWRCPLCPDGYTKRSRIQLVRNLPLHLYRNHASYMSQSEGVALQNLKIPSGQSKNLDMKM